MAIDTMHDEGISYQRYYASAKQALQALYDECKRKNDLR